MAVSCAYRFSGGDEPPFGIRQIGVQMFENRTSETGIESVLVRSLIEELAKDSRLVISGMDQARAFFQGTVKSVKIESISGESHTLLERRVTVAADIRLSNRNGDVLWTGADLHADAAFRVEADKRNTEENLREAILRASRKIAQNVYQQISWGDS